MHHAIVPDSGAAVGQPLQRLEDLRLLNGRAQFVDDLHVENMLHAVVLRSPIAHARIAHIDTAAALAAPGVVAVFTAADLGGAVPTIPFRLAPFKEFEPYRQPVIASDKVRYVGEPVALIVADDRARAEDALDLIVVDYDPLPVVADVEIADRVGGALFDSPSGNRPLLYSATLGDPEAAFAQADYVRTETFRTQRHTALPMETRGLLAEWLAHGGRLRVSGAAKVPFFNRRVLAAMLDMQQDAIDLIENDVGGGFGVRGEFYPEDFLIPFAARALQRPVKWIEDRREHLAATNHSREITCELSLACKRDGTILGLKGSVTGDMGAYIRTNGGVVPAKAGQFLPGPYRIRDVAITVAAVMTNKTPVGTYRGPGRFEANFFRERLIDMAAHDLGVDPMEMRRRNLLTSNELPWSIGVLVPYETPTAYDTGDYPATFERAVEEIGWAAKADLQGRLVDGRWHGIGFACFVESGGAGPRENARLTLHPDGRLTVAVGSSVLGQGLETVLAQVAADALKIPIEQIEVAHGSTTLLDEGWGTYHSRGVVMGGSAVLDAATKLKATLIDAASEQGQRPNDVAIEGDRLVPSSQHDIALADLLRSGPIVVDGTFANTVRTYSYGAHAAHVAVDTATGEVEILDYVAVEDVGRAINPAIVHGQAIGAIVQGLGGVFLDEILYDEEGQLLNGSLADYLVPTVTDFPNVRAVTMELQPSPSNPLGAKGAGEGGIVAVAAATANAVAAALRPLGVRINDLPLSPRRLWEKIEAAHGERTMTDHHAD